MATIPKPIVNPKTTNITGSVTADEYKKEFLKYLTDSTVLKSLSHIFIEINNNKKILEAPEVYEAFFDEKQVKVLLDSYKLLAKVQESKKVVEIKETIKEKEVDTNKDNTSLRYDRPLTIDQLPQVKIRMKELAELKSQIINGENENENEEELEDVNDEIALLNALVKELKNKLNSETKDKDKPKAKTKAKPTDPNTEIYDLEIDPNTNPLNQREIEINIKSSTKLKEIVLERYYLPSNEANITRLNNVFSISTENKFNRVTLKTGKYEIADIISEIKKNVANIEITTNSQSKLIITHRQKKAFDLIVNTSSILPMLGFTDKDTSYKNKFTYTASVAPTLEANSTVYFNLINNEPLQLELDSEAEVNTVVKSYGTHGSTVKKLTLTFTNECGQIYDFTSVFKLCLKLVYVGPV